MSQLLFRLSKLSYRNKDVFTQKSIRLFSTSPYLTLGCLWDDALRLVEGSSHIGGILLFDPAKEEVFKVLGKIVPRELYHSTLMGASQGWGFFSQWSNHNSVCISDHFNPLSSRQNTKMIPLPPLTSMLYGQTKVVWNMAMSSSPHEEEEDCVVAIKFLGRQLSMCKPGRDLAWTNILIPFECAENSNLMYSKRDQRFYLPVPGSNYLCSWDLHFNSNDPKFNELVFQNLPQLPHSAWEVLDSCFREDHWVESPSGQSFLVRWYSTVPSQRSNDPIVMVFREEEEQATENGTRNMCYTEDIGDLCIFLSKSDPFCVVASSCPGLKPNSIYLMGRCFAVCDLTAGTVRHYYHSNSAEKNYPFLLPFWLPPFSS